LKFDAPVPPLATWRYPPARAASLIAATERPDRVSAIVSRGGRPDLAGDALRRVRAPTLLIVGSADTEVLEFNRRAMKRPCADSELSIVPGATHLFEEPGALEQVAELAGRWFGARLSTLAGKAMNA
jgi:pimeloyl-ACP methyl ester carboxylesterase